MYRQLHLLALLATLSTSLAASGSAPLELLYGNPQTVTLIGYDGDAMEPFLSRDGRYLLFNNSNEPSVDTNLHWAERIDDLSFRYRGELQGVNTRALEGVPTLDRDNRFFFVSTRDYERLRAFERSRGMPRKPTALTLIAPCPAPP